MNWSSNGGTDEQIEFDRFATESAFFKLVQAGLSLQKKVPESGLSSLLVSLDSSLACKEEQERTKLPNGKDLAVIQRSRERYSAAFDERSHSRLEKRVADIRQRYSQFSGMKPIVSGMKPSLEVKRIPYLNENHGVLLSLPVSRPSAVEMDVDVVKVVPRYEVPSVYTAPKAEIPTSLLKPINQPEPMYVKKGYASLHPNPVKSYLLDSKATEEADELLEETLKESSGFKTALSKYSEDQARNGKTNVLSSTASEKDNKKKRLSITELAGGDDDDITMQMPFSKKRAPLLSKVTSTIVAKPNTSGLKATSSSLHKPLNVGGGSTSNGSSNGATGGSSTANAKEVVNSFSTDDKKDKRTDGKPPKATESEAELYKGIDPEIAERVLNEIMDKDMNVKWTDIAGLADVKETLKEMIILPNKFPEMFTGLRAPPRGLLLFGPPGNGKTMIAKAIATEAGLTFFSISASVLCSKWIGEGEKTMRALFTIARAKAPAFIFIDEVDSILCSRSSEEHESSRRLKNEFLTQFDGATSSASEAVTIMGATNRPFDLDDAARRRMPKRIYVPLPEHATRFNLLSNLLKNENHCLDKQNIDDICSKLNGYSCSDIHQLSQQAAMGPVRDKMKSQNMSGTLRPINEEDFQKAIDTTRPSVAPEECKLYEDFSEKFGTRGL